jgi:hypothetical protein
MTPHDDACGHFIGERFEIPAAPILRLQGYRDASRIRPRVREIATRMATRAETLIAPETTYKRVGIQSCTPEALELETGTTFHSARFARVLAGCREVVVFVFTLGPDLDAEAERLAAEDEIVEALFLETAGWVAVEKATKAFALHLVSMLRDEGLAPTRRLGPGYVDWPLEEQPVLFDVLAGAPLPVRLLDSCAMIPKKSRSGLYGLRPLA